MIFDVNNFLSDAQAITSSVVSEKAIADTDGLGQADDAALLVIVVEDFADLSTLTVVLEDSADGTSFAPVLQTAAIPASELKAGYRFRLNRIPVGVRNHIRLNYIVSGKATAGKVTAALTPLLDSSYMPAQMVGGTNA